MHIAVFCGSSLPRNKEIVEAATVLGRRIAQEGLNQTESRQRCHSYNRLMDYKRRRIRC